MNDQAVQLVEHNPLNLPQEQTQFAQVAAKQLMEIVRQNGWARKFGGSSEHLQFEAWQTVGKFYGYTVRTGEAKYVEYGDHQGFEATAWVIDNATGREIGGAEAICMNDEANWRSKPLFQLKSMAQTRAGSKALRQILAFVVALAGFNPTPAEEMTGVVVQDSRTAIKEVKARKEAKDKEEWLTEKSPVQTNHDIKMEQMPAGSCIKCFNEGKVKKLTERELQYSTEYCYIHQPKNQ